MKFKAGEGVSFGPSGQNRIMAVSLTPDEVLKLVKGLMDQLIRGNVESLPGLSGGTDIMNPNGETFAIFVDFPEERIQNEEIDSDDVASGNPEWLQNGFGVFGK